MSESERAMTAEDHAVNYLDRNHHDHAAEIAMRTMYELALIWKIERDYRLFCDPDDPRLAFHISDQHVYRVHGMVAALPPPSQLDAVAKKNGFASYDDYNDVVENITLVLSGIDPTTKKYVGYDAATKAQIAQLEANKQMSAKDKKDALAELNESLKSPAPAVANKGNIDLVVKNYDKLADALGGGQQ